MLVAAISRDPKLTLQEWLLYVADNPIFTMRPDREIDNPFTGGKAIDRPDPGQVRIVVEGASVGAIDPSPEFEQDGELQIFAPKGSTQQIQEIARGIARDLGAQLEWLAD